MTVVHVSYKPCTHYIGRPSIFASRFTTKPSKFGSIRRKPIVQVATVKEAITKFEEEARSDPHLMAMIESLPADAVLGCFCKPGPCHGDVIITLWQEIHFPHMEIPPA